MATKTNQTKTQVDPVCGMKVKPGQNTPKTEYNDKEYSFCSQQCCQIFKKNPQQFAK